MLDCGEGSLSQLYALHGVEKGNNILRKLRLILVTHMHADHHGVSFHIFRCIILFFYSLKLLYIYSVVTLVSCCK